MDRVNVALGVPLAEDFVQELQALSPRLRLIEVGDRVWDEIQLLRGSPGSPELRQATAELDAALQDAEVLLASFRLPENVPGRTPALKWTQSIGAGVERILGSGLLEAGVTLTNSRGAAASPVAEWVLCSMLMIAKNMPVYFQRKLKRRYQRKDLRHFSLQGRTLGVLGLGAIGGEIARLSKAMGMTVLATRRTAEGAPPPSVDGLFPPSKTEEVLRASDFVVIALPLTAETTGSVSEPQLRMMKSSAYVINIARGRIIDEAALVRALKEGWIAGAALDVFEREPLPEDSELWALDNVILTPHISGEVDNYDDRVVALFKDNLRRYLAGEPLLNVVDKDRGY